MMKNFPFLKKKKASKKTSSSKDEIKTAVRRRGMTVGTALHTIGDVPSSSHKLVLFAS